MQEENVEIGDIKYLRVTGKETVWNDGLCSNVMVANMIRII